VAVRQIPMDATAAHLSSWLLVAAVGAVTAFALPVLRPFKAGRQAAVPFIAAGCATLATQPARDKHSLPGGQYACVTGRAIRLRARFGRRDYRQAFS
jgi:hypothetical protein